MNNTNKSLRIILLVILLSSTMVGVVIAQGKGNEKNDGFNVRQMLQELPSGTLSQQEKEDFNKVYVQLNEYQALAILGKSQYLAAMATNGASHTGYGSRRGKNSFRDNQQSSILNDLAQKYSITLESIDENVSPGDTYEDTLALILDTQLALIDTLQIAYNNADDADLQAAYSILQAKILKGLSRTSQASLHSGVKVSQAVADTLNRNTSTLIAYDENNPYGILSLKNSIHIGNDASYKRKRGNKYR